MHDLKREKNNQLGRFNPSPSVPDEQAKQPKVQFDFTSASGFVQPVQDVLQLFLPADRSLSVHPGAEGGVPVYLHSSPGFRADHNHCEGGVR